MSDQCISNVYRDIFDQNPHGDYSGCRIHVYQMYVVTNLLTELAEQWWVHMLTPLTMVGTSADRANRAGGKSADRAESYRATS